MGKYISMGKYEFSQCRVLSVTGGSTWLKTPWHVFFILPETPVEIRRFFEAHPTDTLQVEVLA